MDEVNKILRRKSYLNRREKALKEMSDYYIKNKDKISAYKKEWYKNKKQLWKTIKHTQENRHTS